MISKRGIALIKKAIYIRLSADSESLTEILDSYPKLSSQQKQALEEEFYAWLPPSSDENDLILDTEEDKIKDENKE